MTLKWLDFGPKIKLYDWLVF